MLRGIGGEPVDDDGEPERHLGTPSQTDAATKAARTVAPSPSRRHTGASSTAWVADALTRALRSAANGGTVSHETLP